MLRALQIWRISSRLTKAFPDISAKEARSRASRLLQAHHPLATDFAAEYLISGERLVRHYEEVRGVR